MIRAARLALAGLLATPAVALAAPQFTASDIIEHFSRAGPAPDQAAPQVPATARQDDAPLVLPLTGARRNVTLGAARTDGFNLLITFEFNSDRLTVQARQNLDAFAEALNTPALAGFSFEVQGHTDAVGSAAGNLVLSERRARSVVAYLVARGIDSRRLTAHGYGESRPLMADHTHPRNRRVETRRIP